MSFCDAEVAPAVVAANADADANKAVVKDDKANAKAQPKSAKPVANRSVRVDIDKLDVLMNLVSELIIAKNGLVSSANVTDQASHPLTITQSICMTV